MIKTSGRSLVIDYNNNNDTFHIASFFLLVISINSGYGLEMQDMWSTI